MFKNIIKWIKDYYHMRILHDQCTECKKKWSRLTMNYQDDMCFRCYNETQIGIG